LIWSEIDHAATLVVVLHQRRFGKGVNRWYLREWRTAGGRPRNGIVLSMCKFWATSLAVLWSLSAASAQTSAVVFPQQNDRFIGAHGAGPGPSYIDITWFSISNIYYELGPLHIITDGYITRIPETEFYGGGGGLARTRKPYKPDVAAITRVLDALGGRKKVDLLLTGHSHFDHSFDTATWSKLTGARIIGSKSTCFQAIAQKLPASRCTAVYGGEKIQLAKGVTMYVVRWNHSGDRATNPEQHNPAELDAIPHLDSPKGGLHAGVAEDFPNGGGSRAFLFTVDGPEGRFSWFFENSASPTDLQIPIVMNGVDYGAPIENLKIAMREAGLESVDLWIGTGGEDVARLVLPVIKPKAYLPVHWDELWGAFLAGVTRVYSDPPLESLLNEWGVKLLKPIQYMDKWRLDRGGVRPLANARIKLALGFTDPPW
jgi:L-ascorbate metabolism protein UlaG (beta-lactamase superfamily)